MEKKKSHVVGGIVLISIGVAFLVNIFAQENNYWGPIILLGVGLALIVKSYMTEPEKRGTPVGGIFLVILGAVALIDALTGSQIISAVVKTITPLVLPVLLILLGLHVLLKKG